MKRTLLLMAALTLLVAWVAGCAPPTVMEGEALVTDYASLLEGLRALDLEVEEFEEVQQPYFAPPARRIAVAGHELQVFEYASVADAQAEAAMVSEDGATIGDTAVTWEAPPHFYRAGRLIVLYLGDDAGALSLLERTLGPPFAGAETV